MELKIHFFLNKERWENYEFPSSSFFFADILATIMIMQAGDLFGERPNAAPSAQQKGLSTWK